MLNGIFNSLTIGSTRGATNASLLQIFHSKDFPLKKSQEEKIHFRKSLRFPDNFPVSPDGRGMVTVAYVLMSSLDSIIRSRWNLEKAI